MLQDLVRLNEPLQSQFRFLTVRIGTFLTFTGAKPPPAVSTEQPAGGAKVSDSRFFVSVTHAINVTMSNRQKRELRHAQTCRYN